jgi:hypothetical protein
MPRKSESAYPCPRSGKTNQREQSEPLTSTEFRTPRQRYTYRMPFSYSCEQEHLGINQVVPGTMNSQTLKSVLTLGKAAQAMLKSP